MMFLIMKNILLFPFLAVPSYIFAWCNFCVYFFFINVWASCILCWNVHPYLKDLILNAIDLLDQNVHLWIRERVLSCVIELPTDTTWQILDGETIFSACWWSISVVPHIVSGRSPRVPITTTGVTIAPLVTTPRCPPGPLYSNSVTRHIGYAYLSLQERERP